MSPTAKCPSYYEYRVESIAVGYPSGHAEKGIVQGFSHCFRSGTISVLMGRNGCGKSTLLKTLTGELVPSSGRVFFLYPEPSTKLELEYIPQNYRHALFPWKTIRGNVQPWHSSGGASNASTANINEALIDVGLKLPSQDYVFRLSGGQQQLVLIARCMVSTAQVMILDEPLSALDVIRRADIARALRQSSKQNNQIVVCAMHEPDEVARIADEVLLFDGPPLKLVSILRCEGEDRDEHSVLRFRDAIVEGIRELKGVNHE